MTMNMNELISHDELQAESGQALVDYSFILVLVALVCIAALQLIGADVTTVFRAVANGFPAA